MSRRGIDASTLEMTSPQILRVEALQCAKGTSHVARKLPR